MYTLYRKPMDSIDWQQEGELKADWLQNQDKKAWQALIRQLRLELHEERANKRTQELERKAESPPAPEQSHSEAPQSPMALQEAPPNWDLRAVNKSRLVLRRGSSGQ